MFLSGLLKISGTRIEQGFQWCKPL